MSLSLLVHLWAMPREGLAWAEALHRQGQHAGAAAVYDYLELRGLRNGPFCFNQGNAHLLAGNVPRAILAYHRAEQYLGMHAALHANLQEARRCVIDPPASRSDWTSLIRKPIPAWGAVVYLAGWIALLLSRLRNHRGLAMLSWVMLLTGASLLSVRAYSVWLDQRYPFAAVTHDDVVLREGNGSSYPPVRINGVPRLLHRGVEARVHNSRGNHWVQLELSDGTIGWVSAKDLLLDH